jgi:hypothetical protein
VKAGLRRRKNFLPTLILALIFWGLLAWLIYTHPPSSNFIIIAFFILFFLALFLTSALLFANSRRGLFLALFVIIFLLFRYHHLANPLNIIILLSIFLSLEIFFSK